MKVLVIGGAGYIGSHVVAALLDEDHTVTVFDNLSSGARENLFSEAEFVEGDILDAARLSEVMKGGFDALIHLAAFKAAGESMVEPEKYSVNNITGTLNILNNASSVGIRNVVFSSSAAVYGAPKHLPINEEHPCDPENYYGFTKLEIERFLHWYDRLREIRFAALRYFNAAGYDVKGRISGLEKNPANLLPVVMEVAAGMREKLHVFGDDYPTRDGTCIRDYVHVGDLANAHVRALDYIAKNDKSITVNLGSETGITVKEMVQTARRVTGKEIPAEVVARRPGDPAELYATSARAAELLGWKARQSDAETLLSSTWEVYKKQR